MKTRSFLDEFKRKSGNQSERRSSGAPMVPRVEAILSSNALQNNYRVIQELAPGKFLLPMIKANAYGHGAEWAAKLLQGLAGLYGFGVATLEEGAEIREELGPKARKIKIIIFSGAVPWSQEKGEYCEKFGLTPVIATDQDWDLFLKGGWPGRISYELKFNTGMNRLGLSLSQTRMVIRSLKEKPTEWYPHGILSHLAMGEDPENRLSQLQFQNFKSLRSELSGAFPAAFFHLANSAAIWKGKNWGLDQLTEVVRPGLALYGVPPFSGAPEKGIAPVMTLRATVMAVHTLKPGDALGYGGSFIVPKKGEGSVPTRVAILSAGYADGLHRTLSNQGWAWLGGKAVRFLGRVSMDLSAVECPGGVQAGETAEILGPHVDPWAQAKQASTIPYELLTSVSSRVQRTYE